MLNFYWLNYLRTSLIMNNEKFPHIKMFFQFTVSRYLISHAFWGIYLNVSPCHRIPCNLQIMPILTSLNSRWKVCHLWLQAMYKSNRGTVTGYFLAGRFMTFIPVSMAKHFLNLYLKFSSKDSTFLKVLILSFLQQYPPFPLALEPQNVIIVTVAI